MRRQGRSRRAAGLLLVLALLRKREQAAGPEERSGKISVQAAEELS